MKALLLLASLSLPLLAQASEPESCARHKRACSR